MTGPLQLRLAPSGDFFTGNVGDVLTCQGGEFWQAGAPAAQIPAGSYVGQPVEWNGSAYVPLAIGDPLKFDAITATPAAPFALTADVINLTDTTGQSNLHIVDSLASLSATEARLQDPTNATIFSATAVAASIVSPFLNVGCTDGEVSMTGNLALTANGGTAAINLSATQAQIILGSDGLLVDATGTNVKGTKLGFFNHAPVVRPAITGVTTQNQVDSIVAALVALGLVTDGR